MNDLEKLKKRIRELEEENEQLRQEKERIADEKERIADEKERIADEKERIAKEFDKTKKEFEEFKAKHSHTAAELMQVMKIKADKRKASKPSGLPAGHKAYWRRVPERVDKVKALNPKKCPTCKTKLKDDPTEVRSRHVTDIKLVSKPVTTRYDIYRKYCPTCDKIVEQEVSNALPHARLGLNLMLLVMYLKLGLRLPCEKICDFLLTGYDVYISEGEVIVILRQLANAFGEYYAHLEKLVKHARVKHTDTTSWRVDGRNYFAWVFIAAGVVLYKIRKRNNHKVGLAFLKKQVGNVLTIDRYSALRKLAEKAGFLIQFCWSHILSDSKGLARDFGCEGLYVHKRLKEIYALAKGLNGKGTVEMVEQLKGQVFELTQRHYRHLTVWRFVNNLYWRDSENLFRFVTDPEISSTNNVSERELRALVLMRKVSIGSRSSRGAAATAMLLSIVQTLRFRKENVLLGLHRVLKNASGY